MAKLTAQGACNSFVCSWLLRSDVDPYVDVIHLVQHPFLLLTATHRFRARARKESQHNRCARFASRINLSCPHPWS